MLCNFKLWKVHHFKLVPPDQHQQNATEHVTNVFKNQFLESVAANHPVFTLSKWYRILPQSELTIADNIKIISLACPYFSCESSFTLVQPFNLAAILSKMSLIRLHEMRFLSNGNIILLGKTHFIQHNPSFDLLLFSPHSSVIALRL